MWSAQTSNCLSIKHLTIVALTVVETLSFIPIVQSQYLAKQKFSSAFNDFHRNQLNKNTSL